MNDRGFYENLWKNHNGELARQVAIHVASRRPLLKLLERSLPAGRKSRFIEVGCGTALDCCLLLERRPMATGFAIDLSFEATRISQTNAANLRKSVHSAVADLNHLPFPDGHFDLVFSQGVLEHFEDPCPAMKEQMRVLSASGVLVVDVPQRFNLYTLRKKRSMQAGTWPWGWETEYSVGDLRGWASRLGLKVVGAVGHEHGRILDRLVVHPHRMICNKLAKRNGHPTGNGHYQPGIVARAWEGLWDQIDSSVGPYLAINVAVAYRKLRP
jgi:SAM-dependent methyltransferase